MRKAIVLGLMVLGLLSFVGCNKKQPGENLPGQKEENPVSTEKLFRLGDKLEPLTYSTGITANTAIVKTDKGYYFFSSAKGGLCYADAVTGKEMYLCNKPECRHDGNEFCVATTDRYRMGDFCLYGDFLLASAVEETDTQYLYKLLAIALDGSELSEVCTYYSLEKGTIKPLLYRGWKESMLLVHRNKVILPIAMSGQEGLSDTDYYGLGILDLTTLETTFVDEEPVSKENPESTSISVNGDYVYFCRREGKKTVLYRYHLLEGTKESYKLLTNFGGNYLALDDDTVIYTKRSGGMLCKHDHTTGLNKELFRMTKSVDMVLDDGTVFENTDDYEAADLVTDGTYIYIPENGLTTMYLKDPETGETKEVRQMYLLVLDMELSEVAKADLGSSLLGMEWDGVEGGLSGYPKYFSYVGDDVYAVFFQGEDMTDRYTFRCKLADLLAGTPQFEPVYSDLYSKR